MSNLSSSKETHFARSYPTFLILTRDCRRFDFISNIQMLPISNSVRFLSHRPYLHYAINETVRPSASRRMTFVPLPFHRTRHFTRGLIKTLYRCSQHDTHSTVSIPLIFHLTDTLSHACIVPLRQMEINEMPFS
jgi:hypothetical protein